eukprot:gene13779-16247_t
MINYHIKTSSELSVSEINSIIGYWEEEEWLALTIHEFRKKFYKSEFHLLVDDNSNLLSLSRINFDFKIELKHIHYEVCEMVGLVSIVRKKGYARHLIKEIMGNLKSRGIECIGFCEKELRPFYEKCGVTVLYDQARYLHEKDHKPELNPDDDILVITLSADVKERLSDLNKENTGYLIFEE